MTFLSAESNRHFTSDDLRLAEDLAVRAGVAMENARLFELVHQERVAAQWHEERLRVSGAGERDPRLLARFSSDAFQRRSPRRSGDRRLVPRGHAFVGRNRREHRDRTLGLRARRTSSGGSNRTYPYEPDQPYGPPHVLKTGDPELGALITDEMIRDFARDEEHYEILKGLGFRSYMCVPLQVRGRTLGAITFVASESSRRYEPDDLALGEALAYRAGLAIDNARLHGEAHDAVRMRDDFLSIASHELKTPVTTLQLQIQSLLRRVDGGSPLRRTGPAPGRRGAPGRPPDGVDQRPSRHFPHHRRTARPAPRGRGLRLRGARRHDRGWRNRSRARDAR